MSVTELKNKGWKIERHFHQEEAYYYFTASKGRDILTSNDGEYFGGLLNGNWI